MAEMDPNPQYKLHFPFNYENAKWSLSNQASIKMSFCDFQWNHFSAKTPKAMIEFSRKTLLLLHT